MAAGGDAARPYLDPSKSINERVADLVGRMTLEEKAAQMVNTAPAIPRLGVPAYDYWSEGLHGIARSGYSTLFPQAIGMAATFDEPLLGQAGKVVSTEARAKYNQALRDDVHSIYFGLTIWSPNVNIFRDPRWGRGQETYGEDPFLTSRLGTAFVKGLQGDDPKYLRAIATPKHFAVHSGPESERHRFNVDPSAHDLWDTYLPAFRATITEGHADSLMCAYNAINGQPACANDLLLVKTLRGEWGFRGFITSDCWAIADFYSKDGHHFSPDAAHADAAAIRAGTDTNCGSSYRKLPEAVHQGLLQESEIDTSLKRLFTARFRLGLFDPPSAVPYAAMPISENMSPQHTATALRVAREAMVLLKNSNGALPLRPGTRRIAVIGPNAAELSAIEGNYNAIPRDPLMPLDGITQRFPGAHVLYAQGAPYAEGVPMVVPRTQLHTEAGSGVEGLRAEYFNNDSLAGAPAFTRIDKQIDFDWTAASPDPARLDAKAFSVRWTGTVEVPAPGDYEMTAFFENCFPCHDLEQMHLRIDGKEMSHAATDPKAEGRSNTTPRFKLPFDDTRPHRIEITYTHHAPIFGAGLRLSWIAPVAVLREQALEAVKQADVTIAFVGLSPNLEGEEMPVHIPGFSGGDRTDIALPAAQQQLLEAAKATGKPLVMVLMNGSALGLGWAKANADAILEAWYPGQAGAQAIAETLSGDNNPGGRLPVTFYANVDDLPPFTDYNMSNRTYRYYRGKPVYPFGYGLSYTQFGYSGVKLSTHKLRAGDPLRVEADVRNQGLIAGDEVVELYLTPPENGLSPIHALAGFERVHLQPGESRHVSFTLDARQLSEVDARGDRAVRAGSYRVSVGGSQPEGNSATSVPFRISGTKALPH